MAHSALLAGAWTGRGDLMVLLSDEHAGASVRLAPAAQGDATTLSRSP
jgi:hypothetical protein